MTVQHHVTRLTVKRNTAGRVDIQQSYNIAYYGNNGIASLATVNHDYHVMFI